MDSFGAGQIRVVGSCEGDNASWVSVNSSADQLQLPLSGSTPWG